MLWLLVLACDGEEREREEKEDAAYEAGCDEGRLAGSVAGTDDGTECRERADIPVEAADEGTMKYCGDKWLTDESQPCEFWYNGYRDCWLEGYDHSYRIGWDAADCDADPGT